MLSIFHCKNIFTNALTKYYYCKPQTRNELSYNSSIVRVEAPQHTPWWGQSSNKHHCESDFS